MVKFGVPSVEEAMKLGREAADYISGTFIKVSIFVFFFFYILFTITYEHLFCFRELKNYKVNKLNEFEGNGFYSCFTCHSFETVLGPSQFFTIRITSNFLYSILHMFFPNPSLFKLPNGF